MEWRNDIRILCLVGTGWNAQNMQLRYMLVSGVPLPINTKCHVVWSLGSFIQVECLMTSWTCVVITDDGTCCKPPNFMLLCGKFNIQLFKNHGMLSNVPILRPKMSKDLANECVWTWKEHDEVKVNNWRGAIQSYKIYSFTRNSSLLYKSVISNNYKRPDLFQQIWTGSHELFEDFLLRNWPSELLNDNELID